MKPYLLAIDNGSQSTKVTIFDARGRGLTAASSARQNRMVHRPAAAMSAGLPENWAMASRQASRMESQMSSSGWMACPGTEMSYGLSRRRAEARA